MRARFDFGAGEVVGIQRIDVGHPGHVDGDFVGVRRDEERYELARHVDVAAQAGRIPERVQTGDGGERVGRALVGFKRRAHLIGMGANVARELREVDVTEPEHQARGLNSAARIAGLQFDSGARRDEGVGRGVNRDFGANLTLSADGREPAAADARPRFTQRVQKVRVQQQFDAAFAH